MKAHTLLTGHTSPETAYVVEDYPYGFRLRCSIRYWLEFTPGRGVRFWSQTTNPKKAGAWNKPKASTYCRFGGAMFLDDQGHVAWTGVSEYESLAELLAWDAEFGPGLPPACRPWLDKWIAAKKAFEAAKARGEVVIVAKTTTTEIDGTTTQSETRETLKPEPQPAPWAQSVRISEAKAKDYKCAKCGHVQKIVTNHYGNCWSAGHFNCCPQCPPYAKYPEFGGRTDWVCLEADPGAPEKAGAV